MSDYLTAYGLRLERNEEALLKLAKDVMELDPTVEVYHSGNLERKISSLTFFKGEDINSVGFHEVPYRWSGCGFREFYNYHSGGENVAMPFTAEDVLKTFKPVTTVMKSQPNQYFKNKEHCLKWYSWLTKFQFMIIQLYDSRKKLFTTVNSWESANVAAKAIFKRQYWSDLYYSIVFDDGVKVSGSIDLEPKSFHKEHQNKIVTWHLKTFWTNISKLTPKSPYPGMTIREFEPSAQDIEDCKNLLNYLPSIL